MNCPKCGDENPVGDYCSSCGQRLTVSIQTTPEMLKKQKGESRKRTIKIIAIVVVAAVIAIFILSFAPILSEKIVVTINSDGPYNNIHYKLFINAYLKAEGDLAPGESDIVSITLNYNIINEGKSAMVSVFTTDPSNGGSIFIPLQDGSTQSVIMGI